MRKHLILLLVLVLLPCCGKDTAVTSDFTHTGCARTKADPGKEPASQLILRYTAGGLVIIRTNATLNCSIKDGGITCEVSVEGNSIHYHAYETDGKTLKCLCQVERMSSTITGLKTDREYILDYTCDGAYYPINFHYGKDLDIILDIEQFRKPE